MDLHALPLMLDENIPDEKFVVGENAALSASLNIKLLSDLMFFCIDASRVDALGATSFAQ